MIQSKPFVWGISRGTKKNVPNFKATYNQLKYNNSQPEFNQEYTQFAFYKNIAPKVTRIL